VSENGMLTKIFVLRGDTSRQFGVYNNFFEVRGSLCVVWGIGVYEAKTYSACTLYEEISGYRNLVLLSLSVFGDEIFE
jgi:hypothetical protein